MKRTKQDLRHNIQINKSSLEVLTISGLSACVKHSRWLILQIMQDMLNPSCLFNFCKSNPHRLLQVHHLLRSRRQRLKGMLLASFFMFQLMVHKLRSLSFFFPFTEGSWGGGEVGMTLTILYSELMMLWLLQMSPENLWQLLP